MPRTNKTFSVDVEVIAALEKRSKDTGEKMSRLVEQGLRLALAMPPQEPEGESDLAHTRTERAVLEVLRKLGPGPHLTWQIANQLGGDRCEVGVYEKALHALALRGEAHRWGAGARWSDGNGWTLAWDLQSPLERIGELITKWKAHGGRPWLSPEDPGARPGLTSDVLEVVERLVLSIDDIEPVRALVEREMGPKSFMRLDNTTRTTRPMENLRQQEARKDAAYKLRVEKHGTGAVPAGVE